MTLAPNVYSAEPADPILAHSLLSPPYRELIEPRGSSPVTADDNDCSLEKQWEEGVRSSQSTVFRCGTIIGFSRLRTRDKDSDNYVSQVIYIPPDHIQYLISTCQIPRYLLLKDLAESPASAVPIAFIIFPRGFEAFAPRVLFNVLQSRPADVKLPREEAIRRLDNVQLLPVHNFPNAVQAIGKVSEALQRIESARQTAPNNPKPQHAFLIVVGLDTLAEGIIRASNPVRGTALLASTLRNLNRLSRAHASYLSTMLVNTNGIGPASFESNHKQASNRTNPQDEDARPSWDKGLHSIFQTPGSSLLSTLLMKTLDQGIDTHILLSDIQESQIAEVIKSRVGPGLGKWSVWAPASS